MERITKVQGDFLSQVHADGGLPRSLSAWEIARLAAVGVVVASGTWAFQNTTVGGGVSSTWPAALHRTLSLFALNVAGFPDANGSFASGLLWVTYFAAPGLIASYVVDVMRQLRATFSTPERTVSRFSRPVVVCGLGRHGRHVIQELIRSDPTMQIVAVDNDPDLPAFFPVTVDNRRIGGPIEVLIPVIRGDATDEGVLRRARAGSAARVLALTPSDIVNVDICVTTRRIHADRGSLQAFAFVERPSFRADILVQLNRGGRPWFRADSPYRLAAEALVDEMTRQGTLPVSPDHRAVIAGFGRFGQALAGRLMEVGESPVVVIDRESVRVTRSFISVDSTRRFARVHPIDGDILDPEMHSTAMVTPAIAAGKTTFFVCTDNDAWNVEAACEIAAHHRGKVAIVTRVFERAPDFLSDETEAAIQPAALSILLCQRLLPAILADASLPAVHAGAEVTAAPCAPDPTAEAPSS